MITSRRPPANGFVRSARKIYNPLGFSKGYNFVLCMASSYRCLPLTEVLILNSLHLRRCFDGLYTCSFAVPFLLWHLLQHRQHYRDCRSRRMLLVFPTTLPRWNDHAP